MVEELCLKQIITNLQLHIDNMKIVEIGGKGLAERRQQIPRDSNDKCSLINNRTNRSGKR